MKHLLLILPIILIFLFAGGCGCGGPFPEDWADSHVGYFHDEVHEVGIWIVDAQGKLGGRHIFVLPDSEYSNPGAPWGRK